MASTAGIPRREEHPTAGHDRAVFRTDGPPSVAVGDPYAVVRFTRPGQADPPVHGGPRYVVEGVGRDELRAGPGHYPHSGEPGDPGNFAVAGHRTSYGAHFGRLDELARGDLVHVTDHAGRRWTYAVAGHRIVDPGASWVLATDPPRTGADTGTMTLITCHPKWSAAQRLIVFARLTAAPTVDEPPTLRSPG